MLGVKSHHVACEPGQGAHVCGLALFRSSRGSRGGATCKGSIPHLEKPKVRILDYPMTGESVRRLLVADGRCMKEELLSIGEFAKLRGVSVKSLRYYERVGALKPAYVNEESGYRYYSINQISDLDMVTTFIELGVPLKEIASTAALGYGQSELIEKGRELARERIGRAEAQLLQLDRYADEIAESQRFQSKKCYERKFAERLLLCAPLAGDFDMRRYARVTSAIYEAAPGMRLVPLYTEGVARGLGEPFLGVSLGEENGLIAYVQVEMLPSYPFDAEAATRVALEKGMTLVRLPAARYSCDRVRSADFSECFQFGLGKIGAANGPVLLAEQWEPASTPHAFVLEAQAFVG